MLEPMSCRANISLPMISLLHGHHSIVLLWRVAVDMHSELMQRYSALVTPLLHWTGDGTSLETGWILKASRLPDTILLFLLH